MNIKYIIAGLFFLINPNIEVIDIFPDFIGTVLIMKGISKLAATDEKTSYARRALLYCTYLSAAKMLTIFFFGIISQKEMTWMLIFTMCFGAGEAYLLCSAFNNLSKGLTYSGMINDAPNVYNNASGTMGFSVAFICVRTVMSVLPELVYVLDSDYGYVTGFEINWEFVTLMLIVINVIVVTAFGVVWYINSIGYWRMVGRDEKYLAAIDERYQREVASNIPLLTYKAFKTFSLIMLASSVFFITLRLDGIDFLPDIASAALLVCGGIRLIKLYKKEAKRLITVSGAAFIISIAEWILWKSFSNTYYDAETAITSFGNIMLIKFYAEPEVYTSYMLLSALTLVKAVIFVLCILALIPILKQIISSHTGAIPEFRSEATEKKTKKIQKRMNALMVVYAVLSLITVLLDPISTFLYFDVPAITVTAMLFGAVSLIFAWAFILKLTESIENKYMY